MISTPRGCALRPERDRFIVLEVALATHEVAIIAGRLCPNPYFKSPG
jgi:hypothetical protein